MLKWVLWSVAVGGVGAASLTWWRAPTTGLWKASILMGEFGHWLVVVPVAVGALAWWRGEFWVAGLCVVAAAGLLRPAAQAVWIGRALPEKLEAAFGKAEMPAATWTVAMETREVAAGLPMDFYRAVGRTDAPCVVMIHGGGWDNGDRKQLPAVNHHLARLGYSVAAVSYRLAPETRWPGQAEDVRAAIAYLKANAAELGIDPTRLVLMGRSAGGQIATAVAYGFSDTAVRGAVSFYGPQDQVFAWGFSREDDILNAVKLLRQYLGGSPEEAASAYRTASAYLIATKENAVPTLLVHGAMDSMVWHKQSERMHVKLDELGVPNAFVSLPWATHACDFNPRGPSGRLAWSALERFLAAVTK